MSHEKLLSVGQYGLHVFQYPSGRWGFVGTIPIELTEERKQKNGLPYTASKVFDTKTQAIEFFKSKFPNH